MLNITENGNNLGFNPSHIYDFNERIFILCETCYWCATYFHKSRLPQRTCPQCLATELSSFPILPDETFRFDYNEKQGVELEFKRKVKSSKNNAIK